MREEKKALYDKITKISAKIDVLKTTKQESLPNINLLKEQKNKIFEDIENLKNQKYQVNRDWNDKWFKYEAQQKEIEYITEALKKKNVNNNK